ncbi:thioesterase [Stenotrophomonas sp. Betaine-02u-21]|uniref:PaaI family thioesterase n=1 Tax=unclassified Stenotrophomonas TaxID=196198 RepID=UPI000C34F441|nr:MULTISPECIES: PaaI family thioesterase [unclassified Stenotrophomonas]PKH70231.1 thioesterase [Stenotrophomonas sp. Betaine-02u-23]PKH73782.1 thioesterase [Stenotrophomonas sp. Betaine-02u-21]PKH97655.1 thioesterase [Stenotrophomonas sp. Bg11-02]
MQTTPSLIDEIAPGEDGLSQMQALFRSSRKVGIFESLKLEFGEVARGRVQVTGLPDTHAYNPIGTVHGGYVATLLDSACGCATHTLLQAHQAYTTLELKVSFHKAITRETGRIDAIGEILSSGRRVAFAQARLVDGQGRLMASATSTLLIMERRPPGA